MDRPCRLITYALEDSNVHDDSQKGTLQPLPTSTHVNPTIHRFPNYSYHKEQWVKGLHSSDELHVDLRSCASHLGELSAIFTNKGPCNSFHDDLQVVPLPPNGVASSPNSIFADAFDELLTIFQDQSKRSTGTFSTIKYVSTFQPLFIPFSSFNAIQHHCSRFRQDITYSQFRWALRTIGLIRNEMIFGSSKREVVWRCEF
ncbi:hypothetical protein Cgig2_023758 [Carnegiea gigantea]|uniref:Uncharacterized protein n=1 Tax=Carnegiea gigantea TaxID=171969 RepID=A0A9Q1KDP0_9CARY|nr:hypothetical protein Cgig2_023758 [Carnegiea gigantea]